ncbi:MAG: hypothetical protein PHU23_03355 [Dehalococcoidales bacterium]|nr:hypothetical protein [Dehalococcoidales bacterium]
MSQTGSLAAQSDNAETLADSPGADLLGIKTAGPAPPFLPLSL